MKKAVVTILKVLAVLAVFAAIAAFVIYDTPGFDEIMKSRIEHQLKISYGITFDCKTLEARSPIVPDFGEEIQFNGYAEDGSFAHGFCDWKGTILTESYVHQYYAPDLNSEIENIIAGSIDEFLVIEDFGLFPDRSLENYPMTYGSVANADEYIDKLSRYNTAFRVYVRAGVTNGEIQSALDKLCDSGYKGNVYFIEVNDKWFDTLKNAGISCHPRATKTIPLFINRDDNDFIEMIDDPSQYMRGEYIPSNGTSCVVGFPKDPT